MKIDPRELLRKAEIEADKHWAQMACGKPKDDMFYYMKEIVRGVFITGFLRAHNIIDSQKRKES